MRKLLFILSLVMIFALVMALNVTTALADSGTSTVEEPQFFTGKELATYAGALAATLILTQLLKGVGFIDKIPTRVFSWVIAFGVLVIANALFIGNLTGGTVFLCFFNAALISLASNGAYDGVVAIIASLKRKQIST